MYVEKLEISFPYLGRNSVAPPYEAVHSDLNPSHNLDQVYVWW